MEASFDECLEIVKPDALERAAAAGQPEPTMGVFLDLSDALIHEPHAGAEPKDRTIGRDPNEALLTANPDRAAAVPAEHDRPPAGQFRGWKHGRLAASGRKSHHSPCSRSSQHAIAIGDQPDHHRSWLALVGRNVTKPVRLRIVNRQAIRGARPDPARCVAGDSLDRSQLSKVFCRASHPLDGVA